MSGYHLAHLDALEAESIHVLREVAAECRRPLLLFSMGKDSSLLVHLARKAFWPAPIPFPALFVDTTYKFPEAYAFRERCLAAAGMRPLVFRSPAGLERGTHPDQAGTERCCAIWKTGGLLEALRAHDADAAIGGARRDEERSRAKERIVSLRDAEGQWDPRRQRPELWDLYNVRTRPGECVRVFPLANWTELDVWRYIAREEIPVVSLYLARERRVVEREGLLLPVSERSLPRAGDVVRQVSCRFRSIGCTPCTGAVPSTAATVAEVVAELTRERRSERASRVIDHDRDGSMELKKREGYF